MHADDLSFPQVRSQIAGVAWPPLATGPAASLAALLDELDRSQWLDSESLRARQFSQLRTLAEHCAAHSPFFARRLRELGLTPADLAMPQGFARLPALRRRDMQEAADLFCDAVPPDHVPVHDAFSSGSVGQPVRVRRTAVNDLHWMANMIREEFWHRRSLTAKRCSIRATAPEVIHFPTWGGLGGALFETGEVLAIPSRLPVSEQIALIDQFRPDSLLVYPNLLAALLAACRARGRSFEGLSHLRTMAETLSPELREEAGSFFGALVTDSYSSHEIGYLALQCPDGPLYHVVAETVLLEVLREDGTACREGEIGRVLVTDLHNLSTPIIRYDVGDFAEVGPPCPCGRGLPTLKRIVGRERNLAHLPDGRRLWPWFAHRYLRDIAPVRQFQVIQHSLETLELRLSCERRPTADEEAALCAAINQELDHVFAIEVHYFDDALPLGSGGKFEEFICRIDTP